MRYLLDVNALIAFGIVQHQFHDRVVAWVKSTSASTFLTTPVAEIGFVRVVANVPQYQLNTTQAKDLLIQLKANPDLPFTFLPDAIEIAATPNWVRTPAQVTDGHLLELARAENATLATFDQNIPGALRIP
jgi:predicted nucleic acid-binding protein